MNKGDSCFCSRQVVSDGKSEMRNPKHETISKFKFSNVKNKLFWSRLLEACVPAFDICEFEFVSDFDTCPRENGDSNFEFMQ